MNRKKGYLLLEYIISIGIISIIILTLYYLLFFTYGIKTRLEAKVELQQQSNEITKYVEDIIENSKGIISINSMEYTDNKEINVTSIKCKYKDKNLSEDIKDKEISLKKDLNKIFINSINNSGNSEPGGYEIGDYIENLYITTNRNKRFVNIKLELSKGSEELETEFNINIRNFEEEKI